MEIVQDVIIGSQSLSERELMTRARKKLQKNKFLSQSAPQFPSGLCLQTLLISPWPCWTFRPAIFHPPTRCPCFFSPLSPYAPAHLFLILNHLNLSAHLHTCSQLLQPLFKSLSPVPLSAHLWISQCGFHVDLPDYLCHCSQVCVLWSKYSKIQSGFIRYAHYPVGWLAIWYQ